MAMVQSMARKMRAAPWIVYYKWRGKSARDYGGQWEQYWGHAQSGEAGNDVLWDLDDDAEIKAALARLAPHIDRTLPMLDLGCGNGRRTRFLAAEFDRVIGVDVSPAAVELAREQSASTKNASFQVLDALDSAAVAALSDDAGPMNVYMRGVFHVIHEKDRPRFMSALGTLVGSQGIVYQLETDGGALDYFLAHPEDSPSGLPKMMHKVIESGIVPHGFGPDDVRRWFVDGGWNVIESGPDFVHTQDVGGEPGRVPAFSLIAQPPASDEQTS